VLPIRDQRVLFVGGKGGVGKTTVAAALALQQALRGRRTLLVSTDPAHSLSDLFDRRIGDRETELAPGLRAMEIDPEAQVEQHLDRVLRTMRGFAAPDLHPELERQMALTRLSPGAVEAAMLERVARVMLEDSRRYDVVIFDTAPTGHTMRLLSLPEVMAAWTDGLLRHRDRSDAWGRALERLQARQEPGEDLEFMDGPSDPGGEEQGDERSREIREALLTRRRTFTRARRLLLDPDQCSFVAVLVPEKLPILETRKAIDALRAFDVPILGLIVNRVLPREPLGDFLEQRREQEAAYLRMIEDLAPTLPRVQLPLLPRDVDGMDALHEIGGHLAHG
jgi:arsenite/tail-anchored protein-transporting ATPase